MIVIKPIVRRGSAGICFFLALACSCLGDDSDSARSSLKGLPGVFVVVEDLDQFTVRKWCPLDAPQLKTDAELRLRKGGIFVLSRDQLVKTVGTPILSLQVNCGGDEQGSFSVVMLSISQDVALARDPSVHLYLPTWSVSGGTGRVRIEQLEKMTRDKLADQVDKLLNAYMAVNASTRHP